MTASLREPLWPRFLKAPDGGLIANLYDPALRRAIRYQRCCAYFSSSVLSAAASGFGAFIGRILAGEISGKPAIELLVNEELTEADAEALLHGGEEAPLIETLLFRFGTPANALQKRRLEMLAWLARDGWLEVRVGVMRLGGGILHAKFGIFTDGAGDALVFAGSGNESARGLGGNYEQLEISPSWLDPERHANFRDDFGGLWAGRDPAVAVVPLPEAVRAHLIRLAPEAPPLAEAEDDLRRRRAAMLWAYALAAPFMPEGGAATADAMAPVSLWPHQGQVVREVAAAWPDGRLLCDEVGMGKTIEAILVLRRLLAGRGVLRALILTPANLLTQWQGELREKGGLRVPLLEGQKTLVWPDGTREPIGGIGEALQQDLLLLSRETARLEGNVPILLAARPWDLALLDEGHAARRASQVEGEFNSPTLLLGLLRRLQASGQARGIIILSATPMQTHAWEPWDLLQVLGEGGIWLSGFHVVRDYYAGLAGLQAGALHRAEAADLAGTLALTRPVPPMPDGLSLPEVAETGRFAEALSFLPAAGRESAAGWLRACSPLARRMHRNTRATLRRYYEIGLLERPPPERTLREEPFDFATDEERRVYAAVTSYIDRRYAALENEKPGKGFVMTIYRRRAASSPVALRRSLERRAEGLKAVIAQRAYDPSVLETEDAEALEDLLNIKLTSALPDSAREAAIELSEIESLLRRIEDLGPLDTKRDRLIACVRRLTDDGRSVLVFTGYTDTMRYLRDALASACGNAIASYSGEGGAIRDGGAWRPASKEGVAAALRAGRIRVLVCTDAASEGLNLQAAGGVVNFDLPWNPSKIEQRIGRVDRIGQQLPVLPIVNLYLKDSIDQRVYRALAHRCHLFETFVGPMQPVLSLAIRMLVGRDHFDENELERLASEIANDPTTAAAYETDAPIPMVAEPVLVGKGDAGLLLSALEGTGVTVRVESNARFRIDDGPLQIATDAAAIAEDPDAACIDGLDPRQWALLRALHRPGERLPLLLATAEEGPFRAILCAWIGGEGAAEIRSLDDLHARVAAWAGAPPPLARWNNERIRLEAEARSIVLERVRCANEVIAASRAAQLDAARLRLTEELGRLLVCSEPDTVDLNDKFYRLASESNPTGERLRRVLQRLGKYPAWQPADIAHLRAFLEALSGSQVRSRLTGREVDAALDDPRWAFGGEGSGG